MKADHGGRTAGPSKRISIVAAVCNRHAHLPKPPLSPPQIDRRVKYGLAVANRRHGSIRAAPESPVAGTPPGLILSGINPRKKMPAGLLCRAAGQTCSMGFHENRLTPSAPCSRFPAFPLSRSSALRCALRLSQARSPQTQLQEVQDHENRTPSRMFARSFFFPFARFGSSARRAGESSRSRPVHPPDRQRQRRPDPGRLLSH